eukprot:jgi/Tetstr1/433615/TSEL_022880.t1
MGEDLSGLDEDRLAASLSAEAAAVPNPTTTTLTAMATSDATTRADNPPPRPFLSPAARALSAPARSPGDLAPPGNRSRIPVGPRGRAASIVNSPAGGLPRTGVRVRESSEGHLRQEDLLMDLSVVVHG